MGENKIPLIPLLINPSTSVNSMVECPMLNEGQSSRIHYPYYIWLGPNLERIVCLTYGNTMIL